MTRLVEIKLYFQIVLVIPKMLEICQEYRRLVRKAEEQLASYRQRLSQPSLHTGMLETDFDFRPSTSTVSRSACV
jgi:hypothetical protein